MEARLDGSAGSKENLGGFLVSLERWLLSPSLASGVLVEDVQENPVATSQFVLRDQPSTVILLEGSASVMNLKATNLRMTRREKVGLAVPLFELCLDRTDPNDGSEVVFDDSSKSWMPEGRLPDIASMMAGLPLWYSPCCQYYYCCLDLSIVA